MRSKWKVLFLCGFVLMGLAGCSAPRGTDGKTKVDQIIASETIEISDEKQKSEYKKLKDDEVITIPATGFGETLSQSWFDGLIVWPIAQLINVFSGWTDAGIGIILTTLLIQLIVFAFTYKSQMASQRMQEIQPELTRIQNKYKDKTDDRSRMLMAQETQKLYQKYDIHPFGTILVTFIQLPIMMGMYYATMRASAVVYGSFLGMSLSETPIEAFKSLGSGSVQWGPIIIYLLMIVMQIVSLKLPQWMKKYDDKNRLIERINYDKDANTSELVKRSINKYQWDDCGIITKGLYTLSGTEVDREEYYYYEAPVSSVIYPIENEMADRNFMLNNGNNALKYYAVYAMDQNSDTLHLYDIYTCIYVTDPDGGQNGVDCVASGATDLRNMSVIRSGEEAVIKGVERGETVRIYDMAGNLVESTIANAGVYNVSNLAKGNYVVVSGSRVLKFSK